MVRLPPYYIRAVGTTGELAVMASPQAQQAVDAMHSLQWRNEVAPRALFEMMRYKPGARAHRLAIPSWCVSRNTTANHRWSWHAR